MTLDDAVAAVLNGEKRGEADDAIVAAGAEGGQKLVDALNRSSVGDAAMRAEGSYNKMRFERALKVLERVEWPAVVDAMSPYLQSPRDGVRQRVAEMLVGRGDVAAAELAARLLDGSVDPSAGGALDGVQNALRQGRAVPAFRSIIFDRVLKDITGPGPSSLRYPVLSNGAEMLMALDSQRGAAVLTAPPVFSAENPNLRYVLGAIEEFRLKVDPVTLRQMLPGLRGPLSGHAVTAILRYLARSEGRRADDLLREHLRHDDLDVRTEAFGLLMAAKGIDLFKLTMMQKFRRTLRQLHAVHQLLGVNSGDGLQAARHYLSKSQWKNAIELLHRAGAVKTAGGLEGLLRMDPKDMDEDTVEAVENMLFDDPERVHEKLLAVVEREGI